MRPTSGHALMVPERLRLVPGTIVDRAAPLGQTSMLSDYTGKNSHSCDSFATFELDPKATGQCAHIYFLDTGLDNVSEQWPAIEGHFGYTGTGLVDYRGPGTAVTSLAAGK